MNKSDLLNYLCSEFKHLPHREVEKMFDKIISTFSDSLASGNRIEIRNFGSFSVKTRDKRIARNPKTGEKISVDAKKSINFRASKEMKQLLNDE